jgi:hypothetical protein
MMHTTSAAIRAHGAEEWQSGGYVDPITFVERKFAGRALYGLMNSFSTPATESGDKKAAAAKRHQPRYHLRAGLEYLHFSGLKLTEFRANAWTGTVDQARACRRKFPAAAGCKLRSIQTIPVHSEEDAI